MPRVRRPDAAGTLLYILRVSLRVVKFWRVLNTANEETRRSHFGSNPGDFGCTVERYETDGGWSYSCCLQSKSACQIVAIISLSESWKWQRGKELPREH